MSEAGCAFPKKHAFSLVRLCMKGLSSCNLHDGTLVMFIIIVIIVVVVVVGITITFY